MLAFMKWHTNAGVVTVNTASVGFLGFGQKELEIRIRFIQLVWAGYDSRGGHFHRCHYLLQLLVVEKQHNHGEITLTHAME